MNRTTIHFKPDLILAIGSRIDKAGNPYYWDYKGYSEGSVDYISVFGFEKGKNDLIQCLETTSRQTVSRLHGESINSIHVPVSFGFHIKDSEHIIVCGTNMDDKLGCKCI